MPDTAGAIVRVQDLTKRYGSTEAVRSVSFEVAAGEIFGLLGPNGAGKTTTFECLLGLRRPDTGRIHLNGIDALQQPRAAKELVGAQLQSAALQDRITPREALHLFRSFHRRGADPEALLVRFGLGACASTAFGQLSGGQQQRVLLALAFVNDPPLVVLDEPTAGLDPTSRRDLHAAIADLRAAGHTVLLSTHDLAEAEQLCDRIAIIDSGRLVAVSRPADLIARARARARISGVSARPLDPTDAARLPAVITADTQGTEWHLQTTDVAATITGLMKLLETQANSLADLQVRRATLEDVFIELTGRSWPSVGPEGGA